MIVYLCGQVRYLYPVPVLQVQVYLYPGTLPVQVSAEQSYDRSIELSIYFFYWFRVPFTIYLLLHHGITCFHGTLVLNASYNLPPPSQTLLTSMILAYLKTPRPEGPGHGEQVTASAT